MGVGVGGDAVGTTSAGDAGCGAWALAAGGAVAVGVIGEAAGCTTSANRAVVKAGDAACGVAAYCPVDRAQGDAAVGRVAVAGGVEALAQCGQAPCCVIAVAGLLCGWNSTRVNLVKRFFFNRGSH